MPLAWNIVRIVLAAVVVVTVAELSKRNPRVGGLLLSLPLISILAILLGWFQHRDLPAISRLARETLVLVPLGLPLFVPLAFAPRLGLDFWSALSLGLVLAVVTTGCWLQFGPGA
jgi:hypothetical protein